MSWGATDLLAILSKNQTEPEDAVSRLLRVCRDPISRWLGSSRRGHARDSSEALRQDRRTNRLMTDHRCAVVRNGEQTARTVQIGIRELGVQVPQGLDRASLCQGTTRVSPARSVMFCSKRLPFRTSE
jgi:hypothetical protein